MMMLEMCTFYLYHIPELYNYDMNDFTLCLVYMCIYIYSMNIHFIYSYICICTSIYICIYTIFFKYIHTLLSYQTFSLFEEKLLFQSVFLFLE